MPSDTHNDWNLIIGEIVAPFGLAGEMKVKLETDFPEQFTQLRRVCVRRPNGDAELMDVVGTRRHKGQILLKLRGITFIDQAEVLRNSLVQVRGEEAVRLPENEHYIHDLVGCEVATLEGRLLGTLKAVLRSAANDVYVVGEGKAEILLPAIREVVREVDLTHRRVIVSPTPGLLPEDQT